MLVCLTNTTVEAQGDFFAELPKILGGPGDLDSGTHFSGILGSNFLGFWDATPRDSGIQCLGSTFISVWGFWDFIFIRFFLSGKLGLCDF